MLMPGGWIVRARPRSVRKSNRTPCSGSRASAVPIGCRTGPGRPMVSANRKNMRPSSSRTRLPGTCVLIWSRTHSERDWTAGPYTWWHLAIHAATARCNLINRLLVMSRSLHPRRRESSAEYCNRLHHSRLNGVQLVEIDNEARIDSHSVGHVSTGIPDYGNHDEGGLTGWSMMRRS
jgi:hypothetical protein